MKWVVMKKEAIRVNDSMEVPNVVSHIREILTTPLTARRSYSEEGDAFISRLGYLTGGKISATTKKTKEPPFNISLIIDQAFAEARDGKKVIGPVVECPVIARLMR